MTHRELCTVAAKWLRRYGYPNAVAELPIGYEQPDAIGWTRWRVALIECKVSRADFHHDKKKSARQPDASPLGDLRWYMAPRGLLTLEDLPERWGLLEVYGATRRVRVARKAVVFADRDAVAIRQDLGALVYAATRIIRYDDLDPETLRFRPIEFGEREE